MPTPLEELPDPAADATLAGLFENLARTAAPRAPLYVSLCTIVAGAPRLYRLLRHAPEPQRLPVLFLASLHDLVLADPGAELAGWYANLNDPPRSPDDPALAQVLVEFIEQRRADFIDRLGTRSTQTNEVGRCSAFVIAFGLIASEMGDIAHIDVGASGGLNLQLDRFEYHFSPGGVLGGPSTVQIEVGTSGDPPIPAALPRATARCGIDLDPVDVTNPASARWLEACVWPDQIDRFRRLAAAIDLVTDDPPTIVRGDAVDVVADVVAAVTFDAGARARSGPHPVVTNSWVLNYLTPERRLAYLANLDAIGRERDLSWVSVESPALVPELPMPLPHDRSDLTAMALTVWRDGVRTTRHLATCHPHGYWLHWEAS